MKNASINCLLSCGLRPELILVDVMCGSRGIVFTCWCGIYLAESKVVLKRLCLQLRESFLKLAGLIVFLIELGTSGWPPACSSNPFSRDKSLCTSALNVLLSIVCGALWEVPCFYFWICTPLLGHGIFIDNLRLCLNDSLLSEWRADWTRVLMRTDFTGGLVETSMVL